MEEFKPGDLVRSLIPNNEAALFLMVVEEFTAPKPGFFKGVVLINLSRSDEFQQPGSIVYNWQTANFEKVSWNELLSIAAILNSKP